MAGEDRKYADWIRRQPCAKCGCSGPSECHHKTGGGMGLRAHDHDSMPLCSDCHRALHNGVMLKANRRRFENRTVKRMRERHEIERMHDEPFGDIPKAEDVF